MRQYTDIVFDIDGTMLDTEFADIGGLGDALMAVVGHTHPPDVLRAALGVPSADILRINGISEADIPRGLEIWDAGLRRRFDTVSLFPGIAEAVENLHRAGYRLGIVTSKDQREYDIDFVPFGIAQFFDIVVTSSDTEHHKPHPEPLRHYMARAGAEPGRTLYIGDSIYDLECAEAAGADFALAQWRSHCLEPERAKYRFQTPAEILELLA